MVETPHSHDTGSPFGEWHELASAIQELTGEVKGLRQDMNEHKVMLQGPNGDAGLVVRMSVLEARVKWALAIAGTAGGLVLGAIIKLWTEGQIP